MAKKTNQNRMLLALIAKYMTLQGMNYQKELSGVLNICENSVINKLKNPDTFTLPEIRQLARYFGFSDEEKAQII
nr:MAG TPA: Regulatory protein-modification, helix-turn-helix, transcriptional regulator, DNA [Caudoviricetes sp.]